jgi:hypothetical protein
MEKRRKEGMTFEPKLQITLGPPPEGWQRDLFDRHQREMEAEGFSGGPRMWEEYEKEIIGEALFGQGAVGRSGIDELLSRIYRTGVRVTKHSIGYGTNRGQWVVSFYIPASGICREDGKNLPWPPSKAEREAIGSLIGYILRREWVFTAALTPA